MLKFLVAGAEITEGENEKTVFNRSLVFKTLLFVFGTMRGAEIVVDVAIFSCLRFAAGMLSLFVVESGIGATNGIVFVKWRVFVMRGAKLGN